MKKVDKHISKIKKSALILITTVLLVFGSGYLLSVIVNSIINDTMFDTLVSGTNVLQHIKNMKNDVNSVEKQKYLEEQRKKVNDATQNLQSCRYSREQTINMFFDAVDLDQDKIISRQEFSAKYSPDLYSIFVLKCGYLYKSAISMKLHCFNDCEWLTLYHEHQLLNLK
jgi:hypothetical protein